MQPPKGFPPQNAVPGAKKWLEGAGGWLARWGEACRGREPPDEATAVLPRDEATRLLPPACLQRAGGQSFW